MKRPLYLGLMGVTLVAWASISDELFEVLK
jgi:hypothetical protein